MVKNSKQSHLAALSKIAFEAYERKAYPIQKPLRQHSEAPSILKRMNRPPRALRNVMPQCLKIWFHLCIRSINIIPNSKNHFPFGVKRNVATLKGRYRREIKKQKTLYTPQNAIIIICVTRLICCCFQLKSSERTTIRYFI